MPPSSRSRQDRLRAVVRVVLVLAVAVMFVGVVCRWTPFPGNGPSDPWDGPDKAWHALVSFAIAASLAATLRDGFAVRAPARWIWPLAVTLSVGVGKEIYDRLTHHDASMRDVVSDLLGAGFGLLVVWFAGLLVADEPRGGLPTRAEHTQGPPDEHP